MVTSNLPRPCRHPAWQSDVAQDSSRSNSIFYMGRAQQFSLFVFFFINFWSGSWAKPNMAAFFIVGPRPFWLNNFISFLLNGSTSQMGPSCQVLVTGFHLSGKWVPSIRLIFFIFQAVFRLAETKTHTILKQEQPDHIIQYFTSSIHASTKGHV